jgi:fumarate hydratase class II
MNTSRTKHVYVGNIEVSVARLWGAQTQRSLKNLQISSEQIPEEIEFALAAVKLAYAHENRDLKLKLLQIGNEVEVEHCIDCGPGT